MSHSSCHCADTCLSPQWDLAGSTVEAWLETELPAVVENPRMDSPGEATDGTLVHLELQSTNDASVLLRMGRYALRYLITVQKVSPANDGLCGRSQDGRRAPRRSGFLVSLSCSRDPGPRRGRAPQSGAVGDNIFALLAGCSDSRTAVRTTLEKIAGLARR